MPLTIDDIKAALALAPLGPRTDFDLNPEIRADQLDRHRERPAAVLCGLRPVGRQLHVVLTMRAPHLNQHAGQVAFPGGKIDAGDRSARHAALREAEEEVGLPGHSVEVIGALDPYFTSTGFRVTPVVGLIDPGWQAVPDPAEVEEVFEPQLLRLGFLEKTARGRLVTARGAAAVGFAVREDEVEGELRFPG